MTLQAVGYAIYKHKPTAIPSLLKNNNTCLTWRLLLVCYDAGENDVETAFRRSLRNF